MNDLPEGSPLGPPPYAALRSRLLEQARARRERGDSEGAASLELVTESWWNDQCAWNGRLVDLLRLHHDIRNALVGVSGNAQLLMRDPIAQRPEVRQRLEVMLRESGRIQFAAGRLRELKSVVEGAEGNSHAA